MLPPPLKVFACKHAGAGNYISPDPSKGSDDQG